MKTAYFSLNDSTLANGTFYHAYEEGNRILVDRYILGDLMDGEQYSLLDIPQDYKTYSEDQVYSIRTKGA